MMKAAGPAEVIRASQKDDQYLDRIILHIDEFILQTFDQNVWRKWRSRFHMMCRMIYFSTTSLMGLQTLGEEYVGILQTDEKMSKLPSKSVTAFMIALKVFGEHAIKTLLVSIPHHLSLEESPNPSTKEKITRLFSGMTNFIPLLSQIHTVIYYFDLKYYDWSKRLTGIRYILIRKWLGMKKEDSKRNLKYLKWISAMNVCLTLAVGTNFFLRSFYQKSQDGSCDKVETLGGAIDPKKRCTLCFDTRRSPAVTPCGHIFCWECILEAMGTKQECPICRDTFGPSRIVPLANLT